jgi:hypothetical protein
MNTNEIQIPQLLPGSDMATLHKAKALQSALRGIPEWAETMGHLAYLESLRPERRRLASVDVEMEVALADAVESRAAVDLPALSTKAAAIRDNLVAHAIVERAFETTARGYVQRLDDIVRNHSSVLYRSLTEEANEIIEAAREHSHVVGLDAQGAIDTGAVDAWQSTQDYRTRFRGLRSAAGLLGQRLGWHVENPTHAELRWISNPAQVFEHWRAWKIDGALVNPRNVADRKPLRSPWPDHREMIATDLPDAWFTFLVTTPTAQPWVPSPADYTAAANALDAYLADLGVGRPGRRHEIQPDPPVEYVENTSTTRRKKAGASR